MEHRLSKRVKGKLGLLIYKRGMPVAIGQVRDVSSYGLFIATDCSEVELNQTIEIEYRLPDRQQNHQHKLKVHVVRKTPHGVGVEFAGIENDELNIDPLIKWLERHYMPKAYFPLHRQLH